MERDDLLRDQLNHAHSLNALVDNQRWSVLQLLLGFHGVVLSALILAPNGNSLLAKAWWLPLALGTGIAAVGLGLFGAFFSQHVYMRTFKKWIAALEAQLHRVRVPELAEHKGSLYWDNNVPHVPRERTLVILSLLFAALNVGVPAVVAKLLGATFCATMILGAAAMLAHLGVWALILRSPEQMPALLLPRSDADGSAHYKGNALVDSKDHRGWFVGEFMRDRHPLLGARGVEVKWGVHGAGEQREGWDAGATTYHSLTILLKGVLVQRFPDAEYRLESEGDFCVWRPGVPHTWRVEQDSVVLTVRWRGLTSA